MGAWGPAIFSDDVACDVQSCYKELLEDGHEGSEATRLLLERFADMLDSQEDRPVLWLALAATQWKFGRLEDDVKERAIEIIDTGVGLDLWEEAGPSALRARKTALNKLRDQLVSPQPMLRKVRKPWRYETEMSVGDAISYRLDSGKYVILRVVGVESNRYFSAPILELCDWTGDRLPSAKAIQRLPYIIEKDRKFEMTIERTIWPHKKSAYPVDKIEIIARGLQVRHVTEIHCCTSWVGADSWLNRIADRLSTRQRVIFCPQYRVLNAE